MKMKNTDKKAIINEEPIILSDNVQKKEFFSQSKVMQKTYLKAAFVVEDIEALSFLCTNLGNELFEEVSRELIDESKEVRLLTLKSTKVQTFFNKVFSNKTIMFPLREKEIKEFVTTNFSRELTQQKLMSKEDILYSKGMNFFTKGLYANNTETQIDCFAKAIITFKLLIDQDKNPVDALMGIILVNNLYHDKNSEKLKDYIIEKATKLEQWDFLANIYSDLVVEYLDQLDFKNAITYAKKAFNLNFEKNIFDPHAQSAAHYNLAVCIRDFNPAIAKRLLESADKWLANDKDILSELKTINKLLENNKEYKNEALLEQALQIKLIDSSPTKQNAIKQAAYKIVQKISKLQLHEEEWEAKGLQFVSENLQKLPVLEYAGSIPLQYCFFILNSGKNGNYNAAMKALSQMLDMMNLLAPFDYEDTSSSAARLVLNALNICICDDFAKNYLINSTFILNRLQSEIFKKEIPAELKKAILLKSLGEFARQNEKSENELKIPINIQPKEELEELSNQKQSIKTDNKKSSHIVVNPSNSVGIEPKKVFKNNQEQDIKQPSIQEKSALSYETIDLLVQTENYSLLDEKSWHKYFSIKKKIFSSQKSEKIQEQKTDFCWKTKNGSLYTTKKNNEDNCVIKVEKVNNHSVVNNYYAAIDPKLVKKLQSKLEPCKQALISKIKFLKDSIIELCTKGTLGDTRLIADEICQNKDEKSLIIFSEELDHEKVKKYSGSFEITYSSYDIEYKSDLIGVYSDN